MNKQTNTTLFLTVLAIAFSTFASLLGEPFIPFASALVAAIFVTDLTPRRIASIVVSVVILLVNCLIGGFVSVIGLEILMISSITVLAFKHRRSKAEAALVLTVLIAVCTVISLIFGAMNATGVYTLESVKNFYGDMLDKLRQTFTSMTESYLAALPSKNGAVTVPTEDISAVFDAMIGGIVGVLIVVAFAVAGFSLKIFTSIMRRLTPDDEFVLNWRFSTPPSYAYFYFVLYLLSIFLRGNGALALTVANLSTVFMAVYAYVGFDGIVSIASQKFGRAKTLTVALIAILFFSTLAMQLLALFGAYATIATAKLTKHRGDGV